MAQASRDQNHIPSILGISNANGIATAPVYANPTAHALKMTASSGTVPLSNQAGIDENRVKSVLGTSNVDGTTPITIGVDISDHGLFVQT